MSDAKQGWIAVSVIALLSGNITYALTGDWLSAVVVFFIIVVCILMAQLLSVGRIPRWND